MTTKVRPDYIIVSTRDTLEAVASSDARFKLVKREGAWAHEMPYYKLTFQMVVTGIDGYLYYSCCQRVDGGIYEHMPGCVVLLLERDYGGEA